MQSYFFANQSVYIGQCGPVDVLKLYCLDSSKRNYLQGHCRYRYILCVSQVTVDSCVFPFWLHEQIIDLFCAFASCILVFQSCLWCTITWSGRDEPATCQALWVRSRQRGCDWRNPTVQCWRCGAGDRRLLPVRPSNHSGCAIGTCRRSCTSLPVTIQFLLPTWSTWINAGVLCHSFYQGTEISDRWKMASLSFLLLCLVWCIDWFSCCSLVC